MWMKNVDIRMISETTGDVVIETSRLQMRRFAYTDAAFFVRLLNDPDWIRYIGDRDVHNEGQACVYMAKSYMAQYEKMGFGLYLVQLKGDATPIGMCGLIKRDGLDDVDIGFAFLPEFRGKGYALEAAEATIVYARDTLKMKRVVAIATPNNAASIALLRKIGLRFDATTHLKGDAVELVVYAIAL